MKVSKRLTAFVLSVVMLFACIVPAAAEGLNCSCQYNPTIIIPGLFQSPTHLYNEDGTLALNSDGEEYQAPIFTESSSVITKQMLKNLLFPLIFTILSQSDKDGKLANALAETLCDALFEKIKSDSNGKQVYNIDSDHYNHSFKDCTESEKEKILASVPLEEFVDKAGEDHLYYFCYNSLGNIDEITKEFYDYIDLVKKQTGHKKVNVVPISQGATIFTNLLQYYPDVTNSIETIVYIVPALGGTQLISSIFRYGINDEDDALYDYMFPSLAGEDTGALMNLLIRILPKDVLKNCLKTFITYAIDGYLKNSTCLWAFMSEEDYEPTADMYLSGDENKVVRQQTDKYQVARVNRYNNILKARDKGIRVFNIVNYNTPLFTLSKAWDDYNADGVIDLTSEGMGTYSLGVGKTLPDDYKQQGNPYGTCSNPAHNHIDPHRIIDASTCLLPDNTFYYYNGSHLRTVENDSAITLAVELLTDKNFKDVYSRSAEFPQFNNERATLTLRSDLKTAKELVGSLSVEDAQRLQSVIDEAERMLKNKNVDPDVAKKAEDDFYRVFNDIQGVKEESDFLSKLLWGGVRLAEKIISKIFGNKGFFDRS